MNINDIGKTLHNMIGLFAKIGDKRQFELFLSNGGENEVSSTTDNYDVDDAGDKDNVMRKIT